MFVVKNSLKHAMLRVAECNSMLALSFLTVFNDNKFKSNHISGGFFLHCSGNLVALHGPVRLI